MMLGEGLSQVWEYALDYDWTCVEDFRRAGKKMKYLFQTEHLRVRRFESEDADQLYRNHLEEEMKQWIPNESYESLEEATGAIDFYQSCVDAGHLPFVLAVEYRETGELIGDTGVNEVEGATDEVEIGYSI